MKALMYNAHRFWNKSIKKNENSNQIFKKILLKSVELHKKSLRTDIRAKKNPKKNQAIKNRCQT